MANELIAGRYRPIERHAVGGMSAIWRARDEWTGETVAVKRLHPFLLSDRVARERLLREAAALRALDHPSIVRPREVVDDPADPALVMDFATGRSLQARLEETGPLAPDEAVGIMTAVADALAVAHAAGIVHRDIKPANILVDDDGAVQLVDFGIAATPAGADALTAPQTMVGTLRYAAPERLAGNDSTPRSDVWSLGAVLYELISGRPAAPDRAGSGSGGFDAHPIAGLQVLPVGVQRIVGRAMAPDPDARYANAAEFRDALASTDVDPTARTVVAPVVARSIEGHAIESVLARPVRLARSRASRNRWSPVDRAAAGFIALVALGTLLAVAAIGFDGFRGTGGSVASDTPAPAASVQIATDVPATALPGDEGPARGKGNDKGKGNDRDD
jgi:serine/threonine-protein kinase